MTRLTKKEISDLYFEWIYGIVCREGYLSGASHKKLLHCLHNIKFHPEISMDVNRAKDGIHLRHRFASEHSVDKFFLSEDEPCSVLEMMAALAFRMEEDIMDDPNEGDRTWEWFTAMIFSLGLYDMNDSCFDGVLVEKTIQAFLNRKYSRDGKGGLFFIEDSRDDMRKLDIWKQACRYMNYILNGEEE